MYVVYRLDRNGAMRPLLTQPTARQAKDLATALNAMPGRVWRGEVYLWRVR